MNKEESLALFAQGKDAWNDWAAKMLAEREALEKAGTWTAGEDTSNLNEATQEWQATAEADFSECTFNERERFSGYVFPGHASFQGARFSGFAGFDGSTFSGDAEFHQATFMGNAGFREATFAGHMVFEQATFSGGAWFTGVTVSGWAEFDRATFSDQAEFGNATFSAPGRFRWVTISGRAEFQRSKFSSDALFTGTQFSGDVRFSGAMFSDYAGFDGATFSGHAEFRRATFSGFAAFDKVTFSSSAAFVETQFASWAGFREATFQRPVSFGEATFSGHVEFREAKFSSHAEFPQAIFKSVTIFDDTWFEKTADFSAIEGRGAFSLAGATFLTVPDFIQAHFAEAPRLDNSDIQRRRFRRPTLTSVKNRFKGDRDLSARWRALKRLAVQGHDHMHELEFFQNELKTRRWSTDKPWHAVFWFGLFYGWLSNFGRSILRPLLWWAASVLAFAPLYLGVHLDLVKKPFLGASSPPRCMAGLDGEPWLAALGISTHKALLLFGQSFGDTLDLHYACLYGMATQRSVTYAQISERFYFDLPFWVIAYGIAQHIISAVLLFLLLLAVRNHFRIK